MERLTSRYKRLKGTLTELEDVLSDHFLTLELLGFYHVVDVYSYGPSPTGRLDTSQSRWVLKSLYQDRC